MAVWRASIGASCGAAGVRFRVWAPARQCVEVVFESGTQRLTRAADGTFAGVVADARPGSRYRYRLDGEGPYPDPASRFQPDGVHGPSAVVDANSFVWSDEGWRGVGLDDLVVYELHVGTFTPAGTFTAAVDQLPYLRDLGVTAIELMPIADFPGARNWGYDGVALFAPARCYGTPDDLRALIDAAHRAGLGVFLDVVYNHLGPDGNYLGCFSPYYFSRRHQTPWGDAVNLDGPHSDMVRGFFIENALHWVHEYHIDGLRLDATHALIDDSPRHFLAALSHRVHASVGDRTVLLIAEDHRNLAEMVRTEAAGGWGLDAVWADDFHHQLRRALAGDCDGYYVDYTGSVPDLATTLRRGWFFTGQYSKHLHHHRGTDPTGIAPRRFVICLQNHDQVGNRALGERLHHQIDRAAYRAATVLLLCAPETPLLFMGQEWAAGTPFLYFTDHLPELGQLVTQGRRQEFAAFSAFADAAARARIPDPQAPATFQASHLDWSETITEPHAAILRLYRTLLGLRRREPALQSTSWDGVDVRPVGEGALVVQRTAPESALVIVAQLSAAGAVPLAQVRTASGLDRDLARTATLVLTTEDAAFTTDRKAIRLGLLDAAPTIRFERPGAVILRLPAARSGSRDMPPAG
jgi:maltooligosyltrehalose trehalohydrolase